MLFLMAWFLVFRLLAFVVKLKKKEARAECTSIELEDDRDYREDPENYEIDDNNSGIMCISCFTIRSVGFNLINMFCWKYYFSS